MNEQPVYVFAKWQVKEGELDNVLYLLSEVVKKSTAEEGNLFYKVHQSTTDAHTILLYEAYKDEAALATHRASEHFQQLVIGTIVPVLANRELIIANAL